MARVRVGRARVRESASASLLGVAYSLVGIGALTFTLLRHTGPPAASIAGDAHTAIHGAMSSLPDPKVVSTSADVVPPLDDDDKLEAVPFEDQQLALKAEEGCVKAVNTPLAIPHSSAQAGSSSSFGAIFFMRLFPCPFPQTPSLCG